MPTDQLIAAFRTRTAEEIAEAIYQRFSGDIRDDQGLEIAEAIVATRPKPEDVVHCRVICDDGDTITLVNCSDNHLRDGEDVTVIKEPPCPPE